MNSARKVDLTVALPLYNSSPIFWLCLEGLCNQKTSYSWELIVCEDPSDKFCGPSYIKPYLNRLESAGCVHFKYIPLKEWVPLGKKWKIIADYALGENYMLTAADNYSPSDRIQLSCDKLTGNTLWFDCRESLFYNVLTKDLGHLTVAPEHTGVWMCTKSFLTKSLNSDGPRKGVDKWMRDQFKLNNNQKYTIKNYLLGIHTDGMNNISFDRKNMYKGGNQNGQFSAVKYGLKDVLSDPLIKKINSLSE